MVRPPYATCLRLAVTAAAHWVAIDGQFAGRGVDPWKLPISRWFNAIHFWILSHVKEPEKVQEELMMPIPGRRPSAEDLQRDAESFMEFAAAFGVGPPPGR